MMFLETVDGTEAILKSVLSIYTATKTTDIISTTNPRLLKIQTENSADEISKLLCPLVSKKISLTKANQKKLYNQLGVYFNPT